MTKTLFIIALFASSSAFAEKGTRAPAQVQNCTDRDYRGLNVDHYGVPAYAEAICQMKLIMKSRMSSSDLEEFLMLTEQQLGMTRKNINWNQPLVPIFNDIINFHIANRSVSKLALALDEWHAKYRPNAPSNERDILKMLIAIEIQSGGKGI